MRKFPTARCLALGLAALALSTGGAHGQGKSNDKPDHAGGAEKPGHAGNNGNAGKDKGQDKANGKAKQETGAHPVHSAASGAASHDQGGKPAKEPVRKAENGDQRSQGQGINGQGKIKKTTDGKGQEGRVHRVAAERALSSRQSDDGRTLRRIGFDFGGRDRIIRDRGLLDGCPPGLAKKRNGCTPPGLEKRRSYRYDDAGWWQLPGLTSGDYRFYDGNLVRLSQAGSILGYYPLLGGALSPGNVWPDWYGAEPIPEYYSTYYGLGGEDDYRYADNAIYRVDSGTSAITSIAALLTGNSFEVGAPMPAGYDIYNVPYGYRDRYADGPDARYRYSDGYIYEVDPTTQLISAAIELLT